jgi:hypothetical protein
LIKHFPREGTFGRRGGVHEDQLENRPIDKGQANGNEHEQVVHFTAAEEQELRGLQTQFEILLTKDKRLGLAAASRAIWANLEQG